MARRDMVDDQMKNVLEKVVQELRTTDPSPIAPDVPGLPPKTRMLLHRLVAQLPHGEGYLDVGCGTGASVISALLDHPDKVAYGVPVWKNSGKADYQTHTARYAERLPPIQLFEDDFFHVIRRPPFSLPIGIYYYDGPHLLSSQRAAIGRARLFLAPESIFIVTPWSFPPVREGTWLGLHDLQPKAVSYYDLSSRAPGKKDFGNGLGVFFIVR